MSAPETDLTEAEEPTGTTTTTVQSETLSGGQVFLRFMKCYWKSFVTVIVPFAFMPFIYYHAKDKRCIFVFGVMAIFWITQAIPQPITGLLPVLLLPFLGISKVQPVCIEYLREANMMFMGMSLMAFCVQKSGLYKRCALKWMMLLGGSHSRGSRSDRELKMSERQEIKLHIRRVLDDQYDELGPVKATEVLMAIAFIAVILLWIFRSPVFFYGWENGLQKSIPPLKEIKSFQVIKDAGPTIVLVFLLSVLPSKFECAVFCLGNKPLPSTKVPSILEWKSFNKQLHWATFLTIGGGFALFKGILDSKLFDKLNFGFLKNMDKDAADCVILLSFCLLTVVLAQFVSNTALFFIIAPIALRAALAGIVPLLFCFALTFVSFLTIGRVVLRNTTNVGTGKGK
ncbi:hypothetical protein C0J52_04935 [Blattella germanica]|nr:hypothetical protein C0J52_04935 [Blattella germanica]